MTIALTLAPIAAAWRFAQAYRARAGYPHARPPIHDPSSLGLAFESVEVPSGDLRLPAWWIPARGTRPGPAVLLVHGWESARDRTLPHALVLRAIGLHVLTFDVRGHGANGPERLPLTAGEFGADTLAGARYLLERPEVTAVGILGHSMGGVGALLAAAEEPRIGAVVAVAAPAGPYRLTRQTFRLAHLPIPDPIAYPLALLTTRVFLRPRGHAVRSVSATRAIQRYRGPVLLVHGLDDSVVPTTNLSRLVAAARRARAIGRGSPETAAGSIGAPGSVESLVLPGGHSWQYEQPAYRAAIASFLSRALGGPNAPNEAAEIARGIDAIRMPDVAGGFSALDDEPGGLRSLLRAMSAQAPTTPLPKPD